MTNKIAKTLPNGIYQFYWKDLTTSFGIVFRNREGEVWFQPITVVNRGCDIDGNISECVWSCKINAFHRRPFMQH